MEIKINKEIRTYRETLFFGLFLLMNPLDFQLV